MVPGAAGHSQPQTHVDEQPAGSAPESRGESGPAVCALRASGCLGAVAKLGDAFSDERLQNGGVLMHDSSFQQDFL
jgi:hypothetical protein